MSENEENILDHDEHNLNQDQYLPTKIDVDQFSDAYKKAESSLETGLVEAYRKNYDKAIKYLEEAQKLFLDSKDMVKIAICLSELALIHYQKCNDRLIRSLTLLNDAKYLLENQQSAEEAEAKILHYYGLINFCEKRFSEALKSYKNALKLVNADCLEHAKILDSLAIYYLRVNNHQIAIKSLKDALKIKRKIDNKRELSVTELILGRYLASIENFDEATVYLSEALVTTESLGDYLTTARIQDELAKIYISLENFDAAEDFCSRSIALSKEIKSPLIYAFTCCTFASLKIQKHKFDEAAALLKNESEPIFVDLGSARGYAFVKQISAILYHKTDQVKDSIECMHEAVELFDESGVNTEVARCYYELSKIYRDSRDIPMALSSLLEALRIARMNALPILTKKIEDLLFEIDEDEWAIVVNKTAKKEQIFSEGKSLLDTLALLGDMTRGDGTSKDPLLSLLRIGRSIAAETDVDKLLEIIAEETKSALNADRCTVFLLDRQTNELWSKVALGMGSQEIRFPAHMGLAGHVVMTGETINIKDAYNDPRFNKEIDKKTGYKTKTILCMPMRNLNHEIVGVFQVLNKQGECFFVDSDEDLLIAIGSSAGIALENARLFKKQQLMYIEQKRSFNSFINTLAASIDARDKITAGHSKRVTEYTIAIAEQMGMVSEDIEILEYAAVLHDFGKIGIKDSVLCKEGKLTEDEYKHIQEHAFITNEILKKMFFEEKFKDVPEIASSHHEKYNGSGYFRGLKGDEIPLGGRILAVSDVFDAITSKRHYRDRMPFLQVLNILRKDSGSHFDGKIVDIFFKINIKRILNILLSRTDEPLSESEQELFERYSINDLHLILQKEEINRTGEETDLLSIFERHYNPKNINGSLNQD